MQPSFHFSPALLTLDGVVLATEAGTLGRSLLIAILVVSPYGIYKIRQVRRVREAHEGSLATDAAAKQLAEDEAAGVVRPTPLPALEDVIGDIEYVRTEARANGGAMLLIPHKVTVSDREESRSTVDLLVRDALRRSGLVVTDEMDTPEGRLLECALLRSGPSGRGGAGGAEDPGGPGGPTRA